MTRESFFVILLFALAVPGASIAQSTVLVEGFECYQPGAVPAFASPNCGAWVPPPVGGVPSGRVLPDGVAVTGPCGGFPTEGSQWAEVSNAGLGPASPVVPPATPGVWPFVGGTVAELRKNVVVPSFPSGQVLLSVDWSWLTHEGAGGSAGARAACPCNDFAQILVIGPLLSQILVLLYVDTYGPLSSGNVCPTVLAGTPPNQAGPVRTATVAIPSSWVGSFVMISVMCANQGDAQAPSVLFIDNLRFEEPASLFSLTAVTSGGGVGDVTLHVQGIPPGSTAVQLLVSATPASGGTGTGPVFGLHPDGLFFATLLLPPAPFSLLHFPVTASPYAAGAVLLPAGTASGLAGQLWEVTAIAYGLPAGFPEQSGVHALVW